MSPEKEDERPVYESTEGPIPQRGRMPPGKGVLMSGESFGMNPLRSIKVQEQKRQVISDNFLEEDEDDEDIEGTVRASAESGEINPR